MQVTYDCDKCEFSCHDLKEAIRHEKQIHQKQATIKLNDYDLQPEYAD